jgi:glutamine---fructose-6-phosphate transaminase (isomerizing)
VRNRRLRGPDEALPIILEGLGHLEYRGYDSAGVAVLDGDLEVVKKAGKLAALEKELSENGSPRGSVGMGHTRWATHGQPTDRNAHPHLDCRERIAVIHNGIIENFQELKTRLLDAGHIFVSDTDTEVVAHLTEDATRGGSGLVEAVRVAVTQIEDAYAIVVLSADKPDPTPGLPWGK